VGVALIGLTLAGGVLAADRAIDAGLPHREVTAVEMRFVPADVQIRAGEWVVLEFTNEDKVVHD